MLREDTGYTFSFKIYTSRENVAPQAQELSLSERVVVDLMQPLLQKGYHLYIDNWYTGLPLYRYLHHHRTLVCGTIHNNRKGFPEQVNSAKLRRDEQIACRSDELLALKFKDKKDVYMLSTIHDHSMVHRPNRRHQNQCHTKPTSIADYNKYMGGVDRTEQLLKPYQVPRKTLKRYKKLAIHFMQLSMLNSFIVYHKDDGQKPFLGFQCEVIAALIFETGAYMGIPREEHVKRLTEHHFVSPVPETASKQKPQKRCRVCCKKKVRKDSR